MSDLKERVQHVRLLLETLEDPYPSPRGAIVSDSGPAVSRYTPCVTCRGAGEVRVRGGWQLCLLCDGRGLKRREHGELEWDAYMEMPLVDAVSLPQGSGPHRPPDPKVTEESFAWERVKRSYERHGSYRAVRAGLELVRDVAPVRHRLVRQVIVERQPRVLTSGLELELELGVVMVTLRVGPVRVPPWLIEQTAAQQRRVSIGELDAAGLTPGQIARQLGLSRKAVQRKLRVLRGPVHAIDCDLDADCTCAAGAVDFG